MSKMQERPNSQRSPYRQNPYQHTPLPLTYGVSNPILEASRAKSISRSKTPKPVVETATIRTSTVPSSSRTTYTDDDFQLIEQLRKQHKRLVEENAAMDTHLKYVVDEERFTTGEDIIKQLESQLKTSQFKVKMLRQQQGFQDKAAEELTQIGTVSVLQPLNDQIFKIQQNIAKVDQQLKYSEQLIHEHKQNDSKLFSVFGTDFPLLSCADSDRQLYQADLFCQRLMVSRQAMVRSVHNGMAKVESYDTTEAEIQQLDKQLQAVKQDIEHNEFLHQRRMNRLGRDKSRNLGLIEDLTVEYSLVTTDFKKALQDDYQFE